MKNLVLIMFVYSLAAQNLDKKILWNKNNNTAVEFATIKSKDHFSLSNADGYFEYPKQQNITIDCLGYTSLDLKHQDIVSKDTIYIQPKTFDLEEVVIQVEDVYKNMVKTVLSEYALQPHSEKFYLRVVIKKNNEFYKIIDFSGLVEKQTLFGTSVNPFPKNNYKVQINNIRKVGIENRTIDYALYGFDEFFREIASIVLSPNLYKLKYEISNDKSVSKIVANPKDTSKTFSEGFYLLNEDNTFGKVEINSNTSNTAFGSIGKHKHRTTSYLKNTNFDRNLTTNKMQLSKSIIKATTEVITKDAERQVFDATYLYYSSPVENVVVKNNVNLKKDMFDLKMDFDATYWKENEVLPLTKDMQDFVNKLNAENKSKEFRTVTNMK